jgi:negative regulator of flagellin synthesis FlgM
MKIEKTSSPSAPPTVGDVKARASTTAQTAGNKSAAAENSGTSVHLGSTTAQLRSIEGSIASTPVVDAHKVAEIKQAISEGRFQVNSGVVADRLINSVRDLIAASQH